MQDGETDMIGISENSVLAFRASSRRDMANTKATSGDATQTNLTAAAFHDSEYST